MAGKTRKLVRSAVALVATTVAEAALQKAAEDPRVQQKAKAAARSAREVMQRTGKKLRRAVKPGSKGKAKRQRRPSARKKA
jgi:hypothetical protein